MSYTRRKKPQNLQTVFTANTASQQVSDTVLDISNSEISFTPPAGNFEYVVYEYTIQYHHAPDSSTQLYYELREKIGSGSYTQLGSGYRAKEAALSQRFQSTFTGRFFIPIYQGTRTYKMTIRSSAETTEATLHITRTPHVYSPIYQMYCI
jgi:hypothetical protein